MSKVFIADFKNKVLREKGPDYPDLEDEISDGALMRNQDALVSYEHEVKSLTTYPAEWLTEEMDGKEFVQGVDFTLWYPNKVGEPGCVALRMEPLPTPSEGGKKWTAVFTNEQNFIDFLKWQRLQSAEQGEGGEDIIREIAYIAWKAAANAHRMYPDNKHTFTDYWDAAKTQFDKFKK